MTTNTMSAKVLRSAMRTARGDELERANRQFQNRSDAQLDAPYGQSGQTGREVWQGYKDRRAEWKVANALLEEMLQAKDL